MAGSLTAECPHCSSGFKLKSRSAVGKQVNCPSCGEKFIIKLAEDEVEDVDFVEDHEDDFDFGGGGGSRGGYDDDDDFGGPTRRRPSARPSGNKSGGSKPKRKKGESNGIGQALIFGGVGLAALAVLVGAGWALTGMLGGGGGLNFSYLPPDTELVVHMDVRDLAASELLKDQFEAMGGGGGGGFGGFGGEREVEPDDITSMTLGVAGLSKLGPQGLQALDNPFMAMNAMSKVEWVGVIRSKIRLKGGEPGFQEKTHEGTTYWANPMVAYYLPSTKVAVFGSEASLKKTIERGRGSSSNSRFDFVDGSQHVVFAVAPENPAAMRDQQPDVDLAAVPGMPESVKKLAETLRDGTVGVAFGATVDSDVNVKMQVATDSSATAESAKASLDELVDFGKTTFGQFKGAMPGEAATAAEEMLNGLETGQSGSTISISLLVPGDIQQRMGGVDPTDLLTPALKNFGNGGGGATPPGVGGGFPNPGGSNPPPNFPQPGFPKPQPPQNNPFANASMAANLARDKNNLKLIGLALHNYHDTFGEFPTGIRDASGKKLLSWRVQILPYVEESNLFDKFDKTQSWDSPRNKPLLAEMPDIFRSPMHQGVAADKTTYATYAGDRAGLASKNPIKMRDITDGTSNTIAVLDVGAFDATQWAKPDDRNVVHAIHVPLRFGPAKGCNALFFDGSVRFLGPGVNGRGTPLSGKAIQAYLSINGGELIDGNGNVTPGNPRPPVVRPQPGVGLPGAGNGKPGVNIPGKKVVFQVSAYNGAGDATAAARRILQRQPWADTSRFACTAPGEIAVGLRGGFVNTGPAKAQLQAAGFQIGFTRVDTKGAETAAPGAGIPGLQLPGAVQPGLNPNAPLSATATAKWVPVPLRTGRVQNALAVELAVTGGEISGARRYGQVKLTKATDGNGKSMGLFSLAPAYDNTRKLINIEANQRTATGANLYVVLRTSATRPPQKIAEVKGSLTIEGIGGNRTELAFDFEDLDVPAAPAGR